MAKLVTAESEIPIAPFSEKQIGNDTRTAFVVQVFGEKCSFRSISGYAQIQLNGEQLQEGNLKEGDIIVAGDIEYRFEKEEKKTVVHKRQRRSAPKVANAPSIDPDAYADEVGVAGQLKRTNFGPRCIPLILGLTMMIGTVVIIMRSVDRDLGDALPLTKEIVEKVGEKAATIGKSASESGAETGSAKS